MSARTVCVAIVILLLTSVNPSQATEFESSWEIVESGTSEDLLTAAEFEGEIWAFGTAGVMLRSGDNGASWTVYDSPTTSDILNSASGFGSLLISGDSGLVLLRESENDSWIDISLPEEDSVNGISLTGSDTAVAVGNHGTIWNLDGGVWTETALSIESDLLDVSFLDEELGIIVGSEGTILFSEDGGESWEYRESPEGAAGAVIVSVEFYSPTRIYAITDDGRILISMSNVVTGTDVGYIWNLVEFERHYPPGTNEYILGPEKLDVQLNSIEVVTTSKFLMTGDGGYISMSVNGGTIVSQQINPLGNNSNFNDIVMVTGFTGVAVGNEGKILWSENAGADDQAGFVVRE